MMTKAELRITYKKKRSQLTETEVNSLNAGLLQQLSKFDWKDVHYLHTFLPIAKQNEPDMWSLVTILNISSPAVHIVVSRSDPKDHSMRHFLLEDRIDQAENAWAIIAPMEGETIAEPALDVVLVPLLVA